MGIAHRQASDSPLGLGDGSEGLPSVVIAHDFAETFGGAERLVAAAAAVFPDAEDSIWAYDERSRQWRRWRSLPSATSIATRSARRGRITSSYAFAHGFRTRNDAPQVCYCHSPLRFAWSMTDDYAGRVAGSRLRDPLFRRLAAAMRRVDRRASRRVTQYVTGSRHTAAQLQQAYGRDAKTIRPPVDCDLFHPAAKELTYYTQVFGWA